MLAGFALVDEDAVGVLLQLRKVLSEVGVIEVHSRVEILLHSVGVSSVELRTSQLDKYLLDKRRNLIQHLLELIYLFLLLIHILLDLDSSLLILRSII